MGAFLAFWLRVLFALVLFVAYLVISADGLRALFDAASTPLHKTGLWPLTHLGGFAETRKLDVAHVLSLAVMATVWFAWELIIRFLGDRKPPTPARVIVYAAGGLILVTDAILFFCGINRSAFFAESSAFAATVVTVLYVSMLVLIATFVNMLQGRIE